MNSDPNITEVLSANGVGKYFPVYPNRWARLREILTGQPHHKPHWVLRDLSFSIRAGESVGIVGRNGAGKSTLLRMLAGLQKPSRGSITTVGKINAILELGLGFHQEFTGRDNALQLLLMQGVSERRALELLTDIREFSEIGEYFDLPMHTYSTGMQMRVAFSVATAVQSTLLIVDEALAVGDVYFQHKCYERIRALRAAGAAVLLVSHDPAAVRSLCGRALLLHEGLMVEDGPPEQVLETYNALLAPQLNREYQALASLGNSADNTGSIGHRSGSGEVRIESVQWWQRGQPSVALVSGEPAQLQIDFVVHQPVDDLSIGLAIRDRLGNEMFGTNTHYHQQQLALQPGRHTLRWQVRGFHLGSGHYSLTLAAHSGASHLAANYDWWDRCLSFQVIHGNAPFSLGPCVLDMQCEGVSPLA